MAKTNTREAIHTSAAPDAIGTYSQAMKVGNTVYLSGQIPLVPETMELVEGDMAAQVRRVFDNLQAVAEAAVVGMPHDIKGQGIYAFVTLKHGIEQNEDLVKELKTHVRKEIGPIATPDSIQFADGLPKTRSGKIMRRILSKIAAGSTDDLGDTSTLADPSVVTTLIKGNR